ncbi:MAG: class I SAM-dependent methyltransferase [Bryobacteraceae bacterium]
MDNGWQTSAGAWIADMGEDGDFGRRHVLDGIMLSRALMRSPKNALDVGCGEGRFCRMLKRHSVQITGIDPTPALLTAASKRDKDGTYIEAAAERLPFRDGTFDLAVSYLSLIDIPNVEAAIPEIARVLKPNGALLIANLTSFVTACADTGWVKNSTGQRLHYPVDHYLDERAMWIAYRGIRIVNHHRPMSTYFRALLGAGLRLVYFDEPEPSADAPIQKAANYRRAPWFLVMEWVKAARPQTAANDDPDACTSRSPTPPALAARRSYADAW